MLLRAKVMFDSLCSIPGNGVVEMFERFGVGRPKELNGIAFRGELHPESDPRPLFGKR